MSEGDHRQNGGSVQWMSTGERGSRWGLSGESGNYKTGIGGLDR